MRWGLVLALAGLTACSYPGGMPGAMEEAELSREAPLVIEAVACKGSAEADSLRAELQRERRRNLQLELLIETLRKRPGSGPVGAGPAVATR